MVGIIDYLSAGERQPRMMSVSPRPLVAAGQSNLGLFQLHAAARRAASVESSICWTGSGPAAFHGASSVGRDRRWRSARPRLAAARRWWRSAMPSFQRHDPSAGDDGRQTARFRSIGRVFWRNPHPEMSTPFPFSPIDFTSRLQGVDLPTIDHGRGVPRHSDQSCGVGFAAGFQIIEMSWR